VTGKKTHGKARVHYDDVNKGFESRCADAIVRRIQSSTKELANFTARYTNTATRYIELVRSLEGVFDAFSVLDSAAE
jgi:hypothetical protein